MARFAVDYQLPSHHQINKGIRMIIINGLFWLCNWFQAENNNMNIFFLMNGNIFNYSLALEQFNWNGEVHTKYHQHHQEI